MGQLLGGRHFTVHQACVSVMTPTCCDSDWFGQGLASHIIIYYICFNQRALFRTQALSSASESDGFMEDLRSLPPLMDGEEESIQRVYARAVEEEMAGAELSD